MISLCVDVEMIGGVLLGEYDNWSETYAWLRNYSRFNGVKSLLCSRMELRFRV